MQPTIFRVFLMVFTGVLTAGCSSMSPGKSQLSPDREPAEPRHIVAADTVTPTDSLKN